MTFIKPTTMKIFSFNKAAKKEAEIQNEIALYAEKVKQYDEEQKEKVASFFKQNPLKYQPGYEVCNWLVYKAEQYVNYYPAAYGYSNIINEMYNKYEIVNIKIGETRTVKEEFLDDLTNAIKLNSKENSKL